ncbi:HI1506-related protein [Gilliamella bombi]|uniref:HI1506-related protein n=1 Tax=Gilliamella bombi TaxID=1908521 RepID=UPI000A156FF5|nr:HI1506-related protein [Gilliamella bombi]
MEQKIEVINNRHNGYRRAGLTLAKGKNAFSDLTAEQIKMLQADSALTVTIEVEKLNEDSSDNGGTGSSASNSGLGADETGGKGNTEETNGANGESGAKTPEAPKSHLELSQAVVVALAESDESVYFNRDGSPKITKWREVTGNAELTKDDVTEAITASQTKE